MILSVSKLGQEPDTEQVSEEIFFSILLKKKNSHASQVVGLGVILFAYLDMATRQFFPIEFQLKIPNTQPSWQSLLVFMVLVAIVWGLMFELLRLSYYGFITQRVLTYHKTIVNLKQMWDCLEKDCKKDRMGQDNTFQMVRRSWRRLASRLTLCYS